MKNFTNTAATKFNQLDSKAKAALAFSTLFLLKPANSSTTVALIFWTSFVTFLYFANQAFNAIPAAKKDEAAKKIKGAYETASTTVGQVGAKLRTFKAEPVARVLEGEPPKVAKTN